MKKKQAPISESEFHLHISPIPNAPVVNTHQPGACYWVWGATEPGSLAQTIGRSGRKENVPIGHGPWCTAARVVTH